MKLKPEGKAFFTILLSISLLFGLQWLYPKVDFLKNHFKNSRILTYYLVGSDSVLIEQSSDKDSLLLLQMAELDTDDSITVSGDTTPEPPIFEIDEAWFANDTVKIPAHANLSQLASFLQLFKEGKSKSKIRIAYWGDSMIEGDLITSTLRKKFQEYLGGSGVGFVPFVSLTAGFRSTIIHKFGGPWDYHSLVKNIKEKTGPYGYSGEYFKQRRDSLNGKIWASYTAPKGQAPWTLVKLFYGKGNGKISTQIRINKNEWEPVFLTDTLSVNALTFKDSSIYSFEIRFDSAHSTVLYGLSLESEYGAQVDNLSLRGNSGMLQTRIPSEILRGFNQVHHPELIILHYGVNAISASTTNYDWYERALTKMVRHYQINFPNTPILLIGVADKGFKLEDKMISDPSVYRVLKTQYRVAMKTGVTFWSLYDAMGGEGSMALWANGEKPLANKDYTHFNHRGSDKVGNMIFDFLMIEAGKHDKE